jgi:ankyrin repeat protein
LTDAAEDLASTIRLKGKRVPGTCEWVLKSQYETWTVGADLNFLWLIGAPGIGKTVISCFVVEKLQQKVLETPSTVLVHYFCDNKHEYRRAAIPILRGILVQLLQQRPVLFELIKDDYKRKKSSIVRNLDSLWAPLVRMLKSCGDDEVYILIDAIDECEESSRKELLGLLKELDASVKARILITGRPESDIEEKARSLGQILNLDSAKINADLLKFIEVKIAKVRNVKNFRGTLIQDITNALKENHGGTFLWASLVLEDIFAAKTTKAARRKLNSLPSGLAEVYERILENITDDDDVDDAVFILQWVVVSRRPMTVCELATAQALAVEGWDNDIMPPSKFWDEFTDGFKACGPLLYHDPDNDTINLIHQSAKDYLVKTDCLPRYRINREETSLSILSTCWKYLSMQEFGQGAAIIARSEANELQPTKFSRRVLKAYGFLAYATEELRDSKLADRHDLIAIFIRQCENLHDLSALRDFWLYAFARSGHVEVVQALIGKGADMNVKVDGQGGWTALHYAAYNGFDTIVRLLLDNRFDVMSRTKNGETALHLAAQEGAREICKALIENGAEVDTKAKDCSQTPLHLAVQGGHKEVISLLLENGASINEKNDVGNTSFFEAVQRGHEDIALFLLEKGANFKIKGSFRKRWDGWNGDGGYKGVSEHTALFPAAATGCYAITKLLVEKKVDINEESDSYTALSTAVAKGHMAVARLLIDEGADLGWKDIKDQKTLLYLAAEKGHKDILRLLVEKGVDVDAMADYWVQELEWDSHESSRTALHLAATEGSREVVEMLIEGGADLGAREDRGKTSLHLAARYGHESIVTFLLGARAGVDVSDDGGQTALHGAARHGHNATVRLLIQGGANVEAKDKDGWTALQHAADQGHKETVLALIQGDADINARANNRNTVLHVVVSRLLKTERIRGGAAVDGLSLEKQRKDAEMVQLLLKQGSNVEAATFSGLTALHLAAREGNETITDLLLQYGADIDAIDESGMTALHWVVSKQSGSSFFSHSRERVARMLLKRGASVGARDNAGRTALFAAAAGEYGRMCCILLRGGADSRTMSGLEPTNQMQPKVDQLLKATERWRGKSDRWSASNKTEPSDDENDEEEDDNNENQPAESGIDELLQLLFEMAAYILAEAEPSGILLCNAAKKGYDAVVSMLLAGEAAGSITKDDKAIALLAAATAGHEETIRALIEGGVDIEPEESDDMSALHKAASIGHESVVQLLLGKGAKVGSVVNGTTPLLYAAAEGHQKVVEILLRSGANISDYNIYGTALSLAACKGSEGTVGVLLERGASIDERSGFRNSTALSVAVENGHQAVARLLLSVSADVTIEDDSGHTAMYWALERGTDTIVPLLLQHGADPKTEDSRGLTLLSWAMETGREATLGLLGLDRECLDIKGKDGQALLTWAVEEGHIDVISRLSDIGVQPNVQASEMLYAKPVRKYWLREDSN